MYLSVNYNETSITNNKNCEGIIYNCQTETICTYTDLDSFNNYNWQALTSFEFETYFGPALCNFEYKALVTV